MVLHPAWKLMILHAQLKQFSFKSFDYLSFSIAVSGTLAPNLFLGLKKGFYEEQERLAGGDSYATPFHASAPTNVSRI